MASIFADFALTVPSEVELESALRLKTVQYFVTQRPWLGIFYYLFSYIFHNDFIHFFFSF